jgi:hypothetical protein
MTEDVALIDKSASEFTKADILNLLSLEEKTKKSFLFYKLKNENTPHICTIFYNKDSDEAKALSSGQVKNVVICRYQISKNRICNSLLVSPGGSIKYISYTSILLIFT